jgi:hypothetical protein
MFFVSNADQTGGINYDLEIKIYLFKNKQNFAIRTPLTLERR